MFAKFPPKKPLAGDDLNNNLKHKHTNIQTADSLLKLTCEIHRQPKFYWTKLTTKGAEHFMGPLLNFSVQLFFEASFHSVLFGFPGVPRFELEVSHEFHTPVAHLQLM